MLHVTHVHADTDGGRRQRLGLAARRGKHLANHRDRRESGRGMRGEAQRQARELGFQGESEACRERARLSGRGTVAFNALDLQRPRLPSHSLPGSSPRLVALWLPCFENSFVGGTERDLRSKAMNDTPSLQP